MKCKHQNQIIYDEIEHKIVTTFQLDPVSLIGASLERKAVKS